MIAEGAPLTQCRCNAGMDWKLGLHQTFLLSMNNNEGELMPENWKKIYIFTCFLIWKKKIHILRCAVHYLLEISNILVWESCPTFLTRHLRLTRDKFLHTLAKLRPNFVIRANKNIQFRPHRTHAATLAILSLTRSPNT